MPIDDPKIDRYELVAAKAETSTGVAETLTAAEGAFVIINPQFRVNASFNKVPHPADLGQRRGSRGAQSATLTFEVELTGNGASGLPAYASTFFPACNWANTSGTFAATRGTTTLTMALYQDGLKQTIAGARGTFKIVARSGQPARVQFTFTGKYVGKSDATLLAPTFPTVIAPIFAASTIVVNGTFNPTLSMVEWDAGNVVRMREDGSDTTAYRAAAILSRDPVGSLDPEAVSVATFDWYTAYMNGTEMALSVTIGASANNTITIAAAKMQVTNPDHGSREGLVTDQVSHQFNGTSPFTIAYS